MLTLSILAVTASAAWAAECANCKTHFFDNGKGGGQTESDPYIISNQSDLEQLRNCVNGTGIPANNHAETYFKLEPVAPATSIELFGQWTPIGIYDTRPFNGTFDGNNKTISGLEIYEEYNIAYVGLFAYVGANGTVKDLHVQGNVTNIRIYANSTATGGVVGWNAGTVEGCSFSSKGSSVTGPVFVGGVVGRNAGTVSRCFNDAEIHDNLDESHGIGGVVGYNTGIVSKCYNTGDVAGMYAVGGVVGWNAGTVPVSECYNTGKVAGTYMVGGVVGLNGASTSVENCYNTGHVTSLKGVSDDETLPARGGVVGENWGTVQNSYSLCEIIGNFNIGGIVGNNDDGTVENCVSLTWMMDGEGATADIGTNVGRVVGSGTANLSGNKARSDMELRIRGVDEAGGLTEDEKTATTRHGEDVYTYFDKSEPPSNQKAQVFVDWNEDVWEFSTEYPSLTQNALLPILINLIEVGPHEQNPKLPGHPSPGQPGDDDGGCGCDAGGFAVPGLLMLAFMAGIKRLRRRLQG